MDDFGFPGTRSKTKDRGKAKEKLKAGWGGDNGAFDSLENRIYRANKKSMYDPFEEDFKTLDINKSPKKR